MRILNLFSKLYVLSHSSHYSAHDAKDHYFWWPPPWSSLSGRGAFEEHQVFPSLSSALAGWSFHFQKHCTCKSSKNHLYQMKRWIKHILVFDWKLLWSLCLSGLLRKAEAEAKEIMTHFHASVGCSDPTMRWQGKLILGVIDRNLLWQIRFKRLPCCFHLLTKVWANLGFQIFTSWT